MARPKKNIPMDDVKGLKTLLDEGKTQKEIADYYNTNQSTICRKIKEMEQDGKNNRNGK